MILEIFKDSFEYSSKDRGVLFKLGFLYFLNFLIFPTILYNGYLKRTSEIAVNGLINGNDPLPAFDNYSEMFIDGLKIIFIKFIYILPGIILFFIISAPWVFTGFEIDLLEAIKMIIVSATFAIPILLTLFGYLFSIVAIPHMIYNGSFKSAFDIKAIWNIIKSVGLFRYIKFYIGYLTIFSGIAIMSLFLVALFSALISVFSLAITLDYLASGFLNILFLFLIFQFINIFLLTPFFNLFESRAIGLMYNMREEV